MSIFQFGLESTHTHTHTHTDAVLRILEQPLEILGKVMKPDGKATTDNPNAQDGTTPSSLETPDGGSTEHAQKEDGKGHLMEDTLTMEAGNDEEKKAVPEGGVKDHYVIARLVAACKMKIKLSIFVRSANDMAQTSITGHSPLGMFTHFYY